MRKIILSALALLASFQLLTAQDQGYQQERKETYESSTIVLNGQKAPDFQAYRLDGTAVRLSDYKGKVVQLSFWATWCGPCLKELSAEHLPTVLKPFMEHPDFVYIPVAQDPKETLLKFFQTKKGQEYGWMEPITLIDGDRANFHIYAEKYIPRNVIIDREGRVVETCIGGNPYEMERIQKVLSELLK